MASFQSFLDDRPEQTAPPKQKQSASSGTVSSARRTASRSFNWSTLLVTIVTALVSVLLIFSYTRLTVLNDKIDKAKTELDALKNESIKLNAQYEARYDLSEIEQFAQSELGMTKLDNSQVDYVEISSPDTITRVTHGRFSLSVIGEFCTEIVNAVLDILE